LNLTEVIAKICFLGVPTLIDKFTADDYRALPEGGHPRYQLVEGELIVSPSPSWLHQKILLNLFRILDAHLGKQPIGEIAIAPVDVYLTEHDVLQPDLLFISKERSHLIREDGVHGAPDLVIEILSPSNAQLDKTRKRIIYAAGGVRELWLVDPILRQIHLYEFAKNSTKAIQILDDDDLLQSSVLVGCAAPVGNVFRS